LLATAIAGIWIGLPLAANEPLRSAEPSTQRAVNVYLENLPEAPVTRARAKAITAHIFSSIHVRLIWVDHGREPTAPQDGTIIVKFSTATPIDFLPRAVGQAFPYQGNRIQVFYDRVRERVLPDMVPTLLGYVLAHEIAHVLEGTDVHSDKGIMKARWEVRDYDRMARELLTFTDADIRLIYDGLDARSKR
jgi:hypothetical protein